MERMVQAHPRPGRAPRPTEPLLEGVVCWDFDETLGRFYGVAARKNGYEYEGKDGLRHRIGAVLEDLSACGLTNVLTTAAPREYVTEALLRAGLAVYFPNVFAENDILLNGRKNYLVVAEALGLGEDEFWGRSIVIGDIHQIDCPERGVFIYEPHSPSYSATVPREIIMLLLQAGGGDALTGFARLHERGIPFSAGTDLPPGSTCLGTESFTAALYRENLTAIIRVGWAAEQLRHALEAF